MTSDEERAIREAFLRAGDNEARLAMAEAVIGLFKEVRGVKDQVADLKATTLTPEAFAHVMESFKDGAFWREAARRAGVALRAILAAAGAVVAVWAAWEVFGKMTEFFRGHK